MQYILQPCHVLPGDVHGYGKSDLELQPCVETPASVHRHIKITMRITISPKYVKLGTDKHVHITLCKN